jgi:branched-chain amino acid transport system substrate-binding protein
MKARKISSSSARVNVGLALAIAIALAIVLIGCGGLPGAAPAAPTEISIGAVVPLTGRYAAGGGQVKNGYELAVSDINAAGGVTINGAKVPFKLTMLDDESDPTKTVQRMETLYNDNKVVTYLGGFGSDLHAAAAAIAEKNKVPYLGVAFALYSVHQQGFKYLFSPFPKSPGIAKALFEMIDTLNPKPTKYAIFAEKTDWGNEMAGLWRTEIKARNFTAVADEQYAPGATDYTPLITKARDGGAEAILALPSPPDGIALAKQMKELGLNAKLYFFVRAADAPSWSQSLNKDGDFFLLAPGWHNGVKYPGVDKLNQEHQAKYNTPAAATTGPAYASIQILAAAISKANSIDRDKIRDAIAATDMMTVEGPVKFNPDGTGQVVVIIDQWQAGKQQLVWPKDQVTSALAFPATPWNGR